MPVIDPCRLRGQGAEDPITRDRHVSANIGEYWSARPLSCARSADRWHVRPYSNAKPSSLAGSAVREPVAQFGRDDRAEIRRRIQRVVFISPPLRIDHD